MPPTMGVYAIRQIDAGELRDNSQCGSKFLPSWLIAGQK